MKKPTAAAFVLRSALFLPVLFGAPALEWGLRYFPSTNEWDGLARELLSGNIVSISGDDRALKAACLRQLPPEKTWLILGSSRALSIESDWFPGNNVWNAAVSEGGIDDAAALLEAYRSGGPGGSQRMPKGIILDLTPVLVRQLALSDSLALLDYRNRAIQRYGVDPRPSRLYREDFYWDTAVTDAHVHFRLMRDAYAGWGVNKVKPDGVMHFWFYAETPPSQATVLNYKNDLDPSVIEDRTQSQPAPRALLFLQRFLDDLQAHGVRIIVFLPPVNPYIWVYYRARGGYNDSVIRKELNARKIPIVGSYSPLETHATPDDFYDDVHPRPALVHRLLAEAGALSEPAENTQQRILYQIK